MGYQNRQPHSDGFTSPCPLPQRRDGMDGSRRGRTLPAFHPSPVALYCAQEWGLESVSGWREGELGLRGIRPTWHPCPAVNLHLTLPCVSPDSSQYVCSVSPADNTPGWLPNDPFLMCLNIWDQQAVNKPAWMGPQDAQLP